MIHANVRIPAAGMAIAGPVRNITEKTGQKPIAGKQVRKPSLRQNSSFKQ